MRSGLLFAASLAALACAARAEEPKATLKANSYARHLIAAEMAHHPEVASISVTATPPGAKAAVLVASSSGKFGAAAGAEDAAIAAGATQVKGASVLTPLKDCEGSAIGALSVTFKGKADAKAAEVVRDHMARRIAHAGNLLDPWPYDPKFSDRTAAQALVDKTLAAHPEVIILAIHATPPGAKTDVILGSNIGRIGKKADEDDLRVIEKGAINREVNDTGRRFEAEIPLNQADGKRIGALGVVFRYHAGEDKEALVKKAEAIRDTMAKEITSPAALVRKPS
jgi:hypothetical protein